MKKIITLIVISITFMGCGTSQKISNPEYVIGINQTRKIISKDSLYIVTSGIVKNNKYIA